MEQEELNMEEIRRRARVVYQLWAQGRVASNLEEG